LASTAEFYVNARFLTQRITGVQRFALEISKQIKVLYPSIQFVSPAGIIHHKEAELLQVQQFGKLSGHLWEQLELPLFLMKQNKPLLLNLANTGPLFYSKQIVTIHDLAFKINPAWYSRSFALFYNFLIPKIARRSRKILTVSNTSKQEIVDLLRVSPDKVEVIYNAFSLAHNKEEAAASGTRFPDRFVLGVSSLDPRKNFKNLLMAFRKIKDPGLKLVIAGSAHPVFSDPLLKDLVEADKNIYFAGYVSEEELAFLYSRAQVFVYPSLYEGFGIPNLEAMSLGCPVVTSDIPVLREVCGDAACYANPYSPMALAQAIEQVLERPALRSQLIQNGYVRCSRYDWRYSAQKIYDLIQAGLKKPV
jgi:glycosyltransferase involved in cell wall biosynthesis